MSNPTSIPEGRPLSGPERRLLERLSQRGYPEAADYAHQVPNVTVVSRCACECPTIRFEVSGRSAPFASDQAILAEGGGVSPEGVRFGIYLRRPLEAPLARSRLLRGLRERIDCHSTDREGGRAGKAARPAGPVGISAR